MFLCVLINLQINSFMTDAFLEKKLFNLYKSVIYCTKYESACQAKISRNVSEFKNSKMNIWRRYQNLKADKYLVAADGKFFFCKQNYPTSNIRIHVAASKTCKILVKITLKFRRKLSKMLL